MRPRHWLTVTTVHSMAVCMALWMASSAAAQANTEVRSMLGPPTAQSEPFPEIALLEAQVQEVSRRPDAHVAAEWITEARNALQRARTLATSQQHDAAARAQQLALAALAAASHTIARHQADLELAAARRRKQLVQQAANAAQQALTHARAQRAALTTTTTPTESGAATP